MIPKPSTNLPLSALKEGAIEELFQHAMGQVLANIRDPNTSAEAKRKVVIQIAPFRTFPEVAQPSSLFALRLQDGPRVLLKQADGSRWQVEAAANIGQFLINALKSSVPEGSTAALPAVIF